MAEVVPLVIVQQPANARVPFGGSVTFSVVVTGTPPLSYQWRFNGTNLPGATGTNLALANLQVANAGAYSVVVSNAVGVAASQPAYLDVGYVAVTGNGELLSGTAYTFVGSLNLEMRTAFENGSLFYTLDGSAPTFLSACYSAAWTLTRNAALRVVTCSADFTRSDEAPAISITIIPVYSLSATTPGGGVIFDQIPSMGDPGT